MNKRILLGVLFGFVAGLLCSVAKKRMINPTPEVGYKWDVRWPHTTADVLDTVLDEAIHRNGYTGPKPVKN